MSKTGGLNIVMDDSLSEFTGGGAQEVDLSSEGNAVIDPKQMAASSAAEENHKIDSKEDGLKIEHVDDTKSKKTEDADEDDDIKKDDEALEDESKLDEGTKGADEAGEEKKDHEADADDGDDAPIYKDVAKHFYDEGIISDFNEEMDNSAEGFRKTIEDTVAKKIEEYKNSFQDPTARKFLEYMENGGDPTRFIEQTSGVDYSRIDTDYVEDNIDVQKQLLRNQLSAQGEEQEDIEDIIQSFEDSGKLEKMSLNALKKLQRTQEKEREALIEDQKKADAKRKADNQAILDDLKNKIDSKDDIGGFPVTKKTKSDFYDYITKVDPKTGQTGLMTDSSDPEKQLLMSYLYYNNFDFSKLEKKVKTKEARKLEETLGRYTDGSSKHKSRTRTKVGKTDPSKLNLSPMKKLFG